MNSSPSFCSNEQSTNHLTANKSEGGARLLHLLWPAMRYAKQRPALCEIKKGQTTENGSFLEEFEGYHFENPLL